MRLTNVFLSLALAFLLLPGLTAGRSFAAQSESSRQQTAAIHSGTCQDFDSSRVHDLGETSPTVGEVIGAVPVEDQQSIIGFPGALPVATVDTTIQALFGDIFTEDPPHSAVIHDGDTPVACGELGGVEDDGRIIISLQPIEDSRFAGIGVFDEDDAGFLGLGEDEVQVTIYVLNLDPAPEEEISTPEPVEAGAEGEGFVNDDWLVDVSWYQDRVDENIEDADGESDFVVIGVFPLDEEQDAMIPNTRGLDPVLLVPASTSEEDIDQWRDLLLTQITQSSTTIEDQGLDADDTIMVYDEGSTNNATALWWALDYLGHENKYLLEGGVDAWADEAAWDTGALPPGVTGQPVDPEQVPESLGDGLNEDVLATVDDVEAALEDENVVLIDARSAEEYAAGHIPGAVNVPADQNMATDNEWADPDDLRQLYADAGAAQDARVIVYGGDGLDAQLTYFTLDLLGYENIAVYPGGWVEWSQFPALPREEGE